MTRLRQMTFSINPAIAAALAAVTTAAPLPAQVQLDRFFPPVVSLGQETTIKGEGKFGQWPVQVAFDRPELMITPADESGQLRVSVPADAAPGVVWVRCFDDRSASGLVPLLIESAAVTVEKEPNDALPEASQVNLPATFAGRLEKRGDVDAFRVTVRAGQTLVASVIAHRPLGSPMDAVLQIADERGNVLAQSDDQRGLDPQIVYPVTDDGPLWIRVFAFPETATSSIAFAGEASYVYAIRATVGPFVDHVLPLVASHDAAALGQPFGWNLPPKLDLSKAAATEYSPRVVYWPTSVGWQWQAPSESPPAVLVTETGGPAAATIAELPAVFSGHLSQPGEVDAVRFAVAAGETYRAEVRSRTAGMPLDSVLRIVEPATGEELARNDDAAQSLYDAKLQFTAKKAGDVELQISDLVDAASERHAYSVWIVQGPAPVSLAVATDHFLLPAGGEAEVAVTIERPRGFERALRITVEGLPAGVGAEAVTSEAKGDSAKAVKLKLVAEKSVVYQGPFSVVATELDAEGEPTDATHDITFALTDGVRPSRLWLTVAAPD